MRTLITEITWEARAVPVASTRRRLLAMWACALAIGAFLVASMAPVQVRAALASSPVWYDSNAVGVAPDWHYRVSVTLPAVSPVNSTAAVSIDFSALLTQLGVAGTFDPNSVRVVRPGGALAATQEFIPTLFGGATNATAGRGEVRFLVQDAAAVYQVYFDILENGAKPAPSSAVINGFFEADDAGVRTPAGWASATAAAGYDAQVRPPETPSIATDGGVSGNGASPRIVDGNPFRGQRSYLIGARTSNEASNGFPTVTLTRTIVVPATNPGSLTFRYRIQGWDSNVNGNTTTYDYVAATLSAPGVSTANLLGPATNNYVNLPFSPNYGVQQAATTRSGYGQYNGWDTDTNGGRRGVGGVNMTVARGAEPWWTVTQDLSAFAGRTATLTFSFSNTTLYKSWAHIDAVEWSVVTPTLGSPQAFGVAISSPSLAPAVDAGSTLTLQAIVDAAPAAVFADIVDPGGTVVASNIRLFNDGTRGSSAATPQIWVNDGSDPSNPTYTISPTALNSVSWLARVRAPDASTSTLGASLDGLARRVGGASSPVSEANFFNVDDQFFAVSGKALLTHVKSVSMHRDPVNGTVNPKAIPGARVTYTMLVTNTGGGPADADSVFVVDAIPANTKMCVDDFATPGQGPVSFEDGAAPSGLSYGFISLASVADTLDFSNDGAASWSYTPSADADGCDEAITHVRIRTTGVMQPATAATTSSFAVRLRVQVR